jgi:hypothetical protein
MKTEEKKRKGEGRRGNKEIEGMINFMALFLSDANFQCAIEEKKENNGNRKKGREKKGKK